MKAIIKIGSSQYSVEKGDILDVDYQGDKAPKSFDVMSIIDGDKTVIGTPLVEGAKVTVSVEDEKFKGDKIKIVKFKAKKRYKRINGHRQLYTKLKVTDIKV